VIFKHYKRFRLNFEVSKHLNLQSNVVEEKTYNTSNENAMLIKKYQTENAMQVRVPTEKLGELLTLIKAKELKKQAKIFLS